LYNVVTMAGMRWEAKVAEMPMRSRLADMVLTQRLCARDPINDATPADDALVQWLAQGV
jgi:acyl-CoA dehydrogenase